MEFSSKTKRQKMAPMFVIEIILSQPATFRHLPSCIDEVHQLLARLSFVWKGVSVDY